MAPGLPEQFGKYVLLERLGAGGMAEVFRAVLRAEGGFEKQVALKRVLAPFEDQEDFVTLFIDEARIVAALSHTNLCQVFDFGDVNGSHYLAMELVEGLDLGHLVEACEKAGQPFPHASAAFVIAEAARGLDYAHQRKDAEGEPLGIVHRDVSPQNLLISSTGEVKVTDFGIAKAAGKRHRTATGVVMGKLRYMSPEQVVGALALDPRSDVFSLGVILFELLVGGPMHQGVGQVRAAELLHSQDAPLASSRSPDVPPELDRICAQALARDRDKRYPRAADLARDLARWLSSAAPGFTREDLGALVTRMAAVARPKRAGSKGEAGDKAASGDKGKDGKLLTAAEVADTAALGADEISAAREAAGRSGAAAKGAAALPTRPMKLDRKTGTLRELASGESAAAPAAGDGDGAAAGQRGGTGKTDKPIELVQRKPSEAAAPARARGKLGLGMMIGIGATAVLVGAGSFIVYRVMNPGHPTAARHDDAGLPEAGLPDGGLDAAGLLVVGGPDGAAGPAPRVDAGAPDADDGTVFDVVVSEWKRNDVVTVDDSLQLHIDGTVTRPPPGIRELDIQLNLFGSDYQNGVRFLVEDGTRLLELARPPKVRGRGLITVTFQLPDGGNPTHLRVERGLSRARIRLK
ncbi:MAG: serine/threonine protein kinase [Deltaproteobacteria bacterium]|nr:serine/threonine protein kinase [Deltaproteobacteria bacterium]